MTYYVFSGTLNPTHFTSCLVPRSDEFGISNLKDVVTVMQLYYPKYHLRVLSSNFWNFFPRAATGTSCVLYPEPDTPAVVDLLLYLAT